MPSDDALPEAVPVRMCQQSWLCPIDSKRESVKACMESVTTSAKQL